MTLLHNIVFNLVRFFYLFGKKYDVIDILGGLDDIDISKKNRMIFSISFRARKVVMKNHPFSPIILRKNPVFMSVDNIHDLLNFIKENDIEYLQLITCKTQLICKIFNHSEYSRIKIYRYCKFIGEKNEDYKLSWLDKSF